MLIGLGCYFRFVSFLGIVVQCDMVTLGKDEMTAN